jgi:hypothetical protein
MNVIEKYTGWRIESCPWEAFHDPFSIEIFEASNWFEKNQLSIFWPRPLRLYVEALGFYQSVLNHIRSEDHRETMAKYAERDREVAHAGA